MIAGEFAVLQPYHHLMVLAVNRYVYATIEKTEKNRLTLSDFHLDNLEFGFDGNHVEIYSDDPRIRFVGNAMSIVYTYLNERQIEIAPVSLSIKSELDDESGIKYGLGSSAAVVTSVINAILNSFLSDEPSKELIFKLSAISHVITQGNGSGADIAASTYGGMLYYSSFQAEWLLDEYKRAKSISDLVEKDWKYFSVKPIEFPKGVQFCVGWTGNAASTAKLVDEILHLKEVNPTSFNNFLSHSKQAVEWFSTGMETKNIPLLLKGVKENRSALATVGNEADVLIETPKLAKLCDLAEKLDGAGKPSGAGGGDCGIAFMPTKENVDRLFEAWEVEGIKPLSILPSLYGSSIVNDA